MSISTVEQLHVFHAQDREIFSKLVLKFSRSPAIALLVMATWLWLEDFGFETIFSIILSLPDPLIVALADEAVSCFQCLDSAIPPNDFNHIPLTTKFMKKSISLQIIYKHKYSAIVGIKNFLTTICSKIFTDILQQVLPYSSSSSFFTTYRRPLNIPGFPHQTFGNINVIPDVVDGNTISNNNLCILPHGLWTWNAICIATENERTMFLTFSRGYFVSKVEVKELFTTLYGEYCVMGIYMQADIESSSNVNKYNHFQQSLYARLVLDSVATVDRILNGQDVTKFHINGKQIWARKSNSISEFA